MTSEKNNIVNYFLGKIDSRLKTLQNFRLSMMDITKKEDLRKERNEIITYFFEIEDELKQCTLALKAIISENKDLSDQVKSIQFTKKQNEINHISYEQDFNELNIKIQDLIKINQTLNKKSQINETEINNLKEKLTFYEEQFSRKQPLNLKPHSNDFEDHITLYEEQLIRKQLEIDNQEIDNNMNKKYYPNVDNNENKYITTMSKHQNINLKKQNDKLFLNNAINDYLAADNHPKDSNDSKNKN